MPVEGAELRAPQPREHKGEQHELVAFGEAGEIPLRVASGVEESSELVWGQPVALLAGFRWCLEIAERIRKAVAAADPAQETA